MNMKFRIADIIVNERKRDLGDISSLARSIKDLGLLNPITLLQDGTLVAGYHRLSACKMLGWDEIEVNIVGLDTLHAELAEIDENLIRNELYWTERDDQLARRKEIYEALHPETKPGVAQAQAMNKVLGHDVNEIISPTFTQDTASKTKQTPRTIELSIQRSKTFTPEQKEVLKRAEIPQTDATRLARLEAPVRQSVIEKIAESPKPIKVKEAITVVKREELAELAKTVMLPQTIQLLHGGFMEAGQQIDDNSVDLVFTDPPYHEEHLPLWSDLAFFAARVLKPGGILLAYSGQAFLPRVLNSLSEHLDYCWLLGQFHKGQHIQIWKYQLWNQWKPLVLFSKGKPAAHEWFIDAYDGVKGDKEAHEWAQGEDEAQYFIQKLTRPGELVVDPMCGSGSIVRMAHRFNRRSVGIEIDQDRYNVALGTMKEVVA
jgi:hypothetical protein